VILAVSVDSPADLRKISGRISGPQGINASLLLLSDPGHETIDRYGILNPDGNGLPHPATYVIDKEGTVRWKQVDVDYRVRPTNDQVLEVLKGLE
jgi:peroxiredoxin